MPNGQLADYLESLVTFVPYSSSRLDLTQFKLVGSDEGDTCHHLISGHIQCYIAGFDVTNTQTAISASESQYISRCAMENTAGEYEARERSAIVLNSIKWIHSKRTTHLSLEQSHSCHSEI